MMKKILFILLLVLISFQSYSKPKKRFASVAVYGLNLDAFYTGSGNGLGSILIANVDKGPKSIELGMIFNIPKTSISGVNFKFKYYLNDIRFSNRKKGYSKGLKFTPILFYDLKYQDFTFKYDEKRYDDNGDAYFQNIDKDVVTFEHYLGAGIQIYTRGNIYFNSFVGIGGYISSSDVSLQTRSMGYHKGNFGFNPMFEIGIGYKLSL